jgi:hypothetical protein
MITRVISLQVPQYWDIIKYVLKEVENLGTGAEKGVYNHVFAKLMCDKMQCYMITEKGNVDGVIITEMLENEVTHKSTLTVRAIYAFKMQDDRTWKQAFGLIKRAARNDGCDRVLMSFSNPRILELAQNNGYEEISRVMELNVGD